MSKIKSVVAEHWCWSRMGKGREKRRKAKEKKERLKEQAKHNGNKNV
jgi:hypothetical protein